MNIPDNLKPTIAAAQEIFKMMTPAQKLTIALAIYEQKEKGVDAGKATENLQQEFGFEAGGMVAGVMWHLVATRMDILEFCLNHVDPAIHTEVSTRYVNAWIKGKNLDDVEIEILESYKGSPHCNDAVAVVLWYVQKSGIKHD